jgi:hypothetical protein
MACVSAADRRVIRSPGWVAPSFALAALALVPWIGYLAFTLPVTDRVNTRLPWVGFDVALMLALAATAVLAWRGSPRLVIAAACTATMLVIDAWFDVSSAIRTDDLVQASLLALVEVGLAGVCGWIAHHDYLVIRNNVRLLLRRQAASRAAAAAVRRPPAPGRRAQTPPEEQDA